MRTAKVKIIERDERGILRTLGEVEVSGRSVDTLAARARAEAEKRGRKVLSLSHIYGDGIAVYVGPVDAPRGQPKVTPVRPMARPDRPAR